MGRPRMACQHPGFMLKNICLALLAAAMAAQAASSIRPERLRCEYRENPLGIDTPNPRLGWWNTPSSASRRALTQTAWQILAATHPDKLAVGQADLWDSGQVASSQSAHVVYGGKALGSEAQCWWSVRIWDQDQGASAWSAPARFTLGLLRPQDWTAQWIGRDETPTPDSAPNPLRKSRWIWSPESTPPAQAAPVAPRWFRRAFVLPKDRAVRKAVCSMTADNSFECRLNGARIGAGGNFNESVSMDATELLKPGTNLLAVLARNAGDSPNPAGLIASLRVEFESGAPWTLETDAAWKSADAETAGWEKPGFDDSRWAAVKILGTNGMAPWKLVGASDNSELPARYLRREFEAPKKIRRATVYMSGLGWSELYVNGRKSGDDVLSPGLTHYSNRVFYVTHDVTSLLRRGPNALGVILGNGRFFAPRQTTPMTTLTYGYPKLLLQLRVEFDDGSSSLVASDESWRLTTRGPVRANNEYDGEDYDARKDIDGWAAPGFSDTTWDHARRVAPPSGVLAAQMMEPGRVTQTLKPVRLTQQRPGVWIYDLGQNISGWCRLSVSGPAGTRVTLRHSETLKPDGSLYLDNIRGARVTDTYTLRGGGRELWEPRFTYHGFRFVEVRGYPGQPGLNDLQGRVVHDALPAAGDFECSNEVVNQIYRNIVWGVRDNYHTFPTDCPQRDERQGWLGDRSAECKGESYLHNIAPLYAKWTRDFEDAQRPGGSVPDVAPPYWPLYNDGVTWPSSTLFVPAMLLEQYADTRLLQSHYPSMVLWMDWMSRYLTNNIMPRDTYGDWCVPPEDPRLIHSSDPARKTRGDLIGTAYFHACARLMSRFAAVLDKGADVRRWNDLAAALKLAFNDRFLDASTARYDNGSQTSSVLPLALGLAPDALREKIFAGLARKIAGEGSPAIGTGLIGGQWLMRTLTDGGRPDIAWALASRTNYPSWGYMAAQGATTIWELWNGNTADPAMNSGNHVMLIGDLVIWFYENLAGIAPDPASPGFKHLLMKPVLPAGLDRVSAWHDTLYGRVESRWSRPAGRFQWDLTLPPNTTATLWIPARDLESVTENGAPASTARGLKFLRMQDDAALFEAGSGRYRFASTPR